MPLYKYRTIDANGTDASGTMTESSARRVTAVLQEQGLQVTEVTQAAADPPMPRLKSRLSWDDIEFLNTQLLAFLRSGLPMAPALRAIAKELRRSALRTVVDDVHNAIDRGESISDALERHRRSLPRVYIAAIRAGEAAGNLPAVLEQCAGYSAQMVKLKSRMREAFAYPIFVVVAAGALMTFLMTSTVPAFEAVFKDFGAKLPAITLFWITASHMIRSYFVFVATFVAVAIASILVVTRTPQGRYALDWIKIKTFGIGTAFNTASMARFCRSLAILLSGNAPIDSSIELASATCGNAVLESAAMDAARSVREGTRLALAFEMTGYYAGLFCWLVEVSEKRGDLPDALFNLARNYEETFNRYSRVLVSIVTPIVLMLMALLVVSIVLSLYLPIFTLADVISGS